MHSENLRRAGLQRVLKQPTATLVAPDARLSVKLSSANLRVADLAISLPYEAEDSAGNVALGTTDGL